MGQRVVDVRDVGAGRTGDGLDRELLAELLCLGAGFDEVLHAYLDTAPGQLDALARAVDDGDARSVARTAHVLAGSSGCVGARRLSAGCSAVEQEAHAGRIAGASAVMALRRDHDVAAAALAALLAGGVERARAGR